MYLMSAAWASLAVVLSGLGAVYGWFAWKRQGLRGLVRGAALVTAPIGLWLTGTLRLVSAIVDWFASWATGLVLSPSVIVGTVLLVLAVVLWAASARMSGGRAPRGADQPVVRRPGEVAARPPGRGAPAAADDDLADIEALLRRRGIS